MLRAALGAGVFFALHALLALAMPGALGGGDVKLAVPLGAVLGVLGPTWMLVALVVAAVVTLALIVVVPRWRSGAPHGPGLLGVTCALVIAVGVPGVSPVIAPRLPGADVELNAPLAIEGFRRVG
ncbi:hypothetical protein ACFQV2_12250 [Actinokineospora soli]|uniref:Leader peptidase (Prepilin peptidase) / N-methyltransferase n=1 Tax=Actinokineospora soli TaxID=1048753 RepID=A0ABW2TLF7_9PSEU